MLLHSFERKRKSKGRVFLYREEIRVFSAFPHPRIHGGKDNSGAFSCLDLQKKRRHYSLSQQQKEKGRRAADEECAKKKKKVRDVQELLG